MAGWVESSPAAFTVSVLVGGAAAEIHFLKGAGGGERTPEVHFRFAPQTDMAVGVLRGAERK